MIIVVYQKHKASSMSLFKNRLIDKCGEKIEFRGGLFQ